MTTVECDEPPEDLQGGYDDLPADRRAQRPVEWNPAAWTKWDELVPFLDGLPPQISREDVVARARTAHTSEQAALSTFVASMVWGYGRVGYGAYRTSRILECNDDAGRRLRTVAQAALETDPADAFDVLARNRLSRLGPAFGTKYLYFCTAAHRDEHEGRTAPVLDQVVRRWFARHAGVALDGSWSGANYRRYLGLLERWGLRLGIPSDLVEEIVFERQAARERSRRTRPGTVVAREPVEDALAVLDELRVAVEQVGSDVSDEAAGHLDAVARILGADRRT